MNSIYKAILPTLNDLNHLESETKEYENGKVEINFPNGLGVSSLIIENNSVVFYDSLVEDINKNTNKVFSYTLENKDGLDYIANEIKEILLDENEGLDLYRNSFSDR